MSAGAGKWGDLRPRILSAVVMVVVAGVDIWLGGYWFLALLALVAAAMVWEVARLGGAASGPLRDVLLPVSGALATLAAAWLGSPLGFVVIACVAAGVWVLSEQLRHRLALYAFFCMVAALALYAIRDVFGLAVLLWLIGVVIVSDVMGYFAGRVLGGPKFWPKVSPKKTWSGTVAGWIGAALLGWYMSDMTLAASKLDWPIPLAVISVVLAFAAQMGDIVESAFKRKAGIKDSSNLIPGHGGVLDRFDGMIGAALVFFPVLFLAGLAA
ncbi:phosphatidate cytidylyltransferase [Lentibacter sp. XHP0401]|uniref:phosphatidate cytidylyltransferase n=1 Tax=Lentibacter sp. XHP0401 TaxID=2984334 RepID=UPI0021E70CE0|nr:phosphatidate cytidylyltransferase [Lentibacter sp. XHP0401]MCV2892146.1 phosphatidate cytidylyltransferase [Lentibacter sp. XHP0401]